MKKILFAFAILISATQISLAQDAQATKKPQFQWNKKIMTEIGISEEVQAKIEDVKKTANTELKKVREDAALAEDVKKKTLKELNAKRQKDIEAFLTPEQKAKADALKKEMSN
jgi:Spy/CpxP family protein refolding chaperone